MVAGIESGGEARWWPASKAEGRRDGGDEYRDGGDGRLADLRRLASREDENLSLGLRTILSFKGNVVLQQGNNMHKNLHQLNQSQSQSQKLNNKCHNSMYHIKNLKRVKLKKKTEKEEETFDINSLTSPDF
ncbi:hypothetical protein VIGAN_04235600 [Vigna angularis var. angularis]|uniref:Uncharacterized protein n=1 Tax=Vigna angularis var. angularis TaxID=157739 RepID=A0A0S3RWB5_PHAAN|nr:hypothetical protein VIGAN_04235600 [Vigna angularis var. angularis]